MDIHRGSKIVCPFHNDKNPSMKVDSRFHCFGCGEDGDVIDFVSKYFNITKIEAARKIADEFNICTDDNYRNCVTGIRKKQKVNYRQIKNDTVLYLINLEKELKLWMKDYAPKPEDERLHFLFVTAIKNIDYVGYLIDELTDCITDEEIEKFLGNHKNEVIV